MEADLLSRGFELMLAGMGVVFLFLTVLVWATTLMSSVVTRFRSPDRPAERQEEIAAITAAIAHHRNRRRN